MERTILVRSDRNIWEHLWRWSTLTGLVISVGQTNMSLCTWQNCCPQYRYFVSYLQEQWPNAWWLGSGLCNRNVPFHSLRSISNWNFCWWKASLHYQDQLSSRPEEPTSNHCQCCIARHLCFHKLATDWSVLTIESFYSYGQHLCKFIGTKESSWLRKEFNSHRIGSVWDTNLAAVSFFGRPIWPPWRHVKSHCTQPLGVPWDTHGWRLNPSHYPTGDHLLTKGSDKSRYEIKGDCNITNILQDTTIPDWPRYLPPCPTPFKSPHSVL